MKFEIETVATGTVAAEEIKKVRTVLDGPCTAFQVLRNNGDWVTLTLITPKGTVYNYSSNARIVGLCPQP